MGNNTEEESSEFMTANMVCITVAWDALYRGILDHAQLAGQLCSHTPQAQQPGTQWMKKNTAPPEGSAGPFFLLLQHRHKTPNQNRSILQEGTSSEPSPQPTSSTYFLLATSCCLVTPWTLCACTEAIHDDICLQLKTLCAKGRGQKKKKRLKKKALTQAVL